MLNIDVGNMLKTNGSHLGKAKIIFKSAFIERVFVSSLEGKFKLQTFDEDLVKGWSQAEKLFI